MSDIASIRASRWAEATAILTDSLGNMPKERQLMQTIGKEWLDIYDLNAQYSSAKAATEELLKDTEREVLEVETAAQKSTEDISMLQKKIDVLMQSQARRKSTMEADAQKSENTYTTATNILNDRITAAQTQLAMLQEMIEGYEPQRFLKNEQAQDLYLQLRALLTAQEKELRTFLRPLTKSTELP